MSAKFPRGGQDLFFLARSLNTSSIYDSIVFHVIITVYFLSNKHLRNKHLLIIVSEYGQETPQSQTADKPIGTARKSHTTITRHPEDKL